MNLLKKVRLFFKYIFKLSLWNTLRINFRFLPFRQALKLPIFIFRRSELHIGKNAQLQFECPLQTGMVKIGAIDFRWIPAGSHNYLSLDGKIIVKGPNIVLGYNSTIVLAKEACINLGGENILNHDTKLLIHQELTMDFGARMGWNCQICDSSFHYVVVDGKVARKTKPIYIGREAWVSSYCLIGRGAVLPNYSVLAQSSMLNKNFSQEGECLLLGGIPAKVLKHDVKRIMESVQPELCSAIDEYFTTNHAAHTVDIQKFRKHMTYPIKLNNEDR